MVGSLVRRRKHPLIPLSGMAAYRCTVMLCRRTGATRAPTTTGARASPQVSGLDTPTHQIPADAAFQQVAAPARRAGRRRSGWEIARAGTSAARLRARRHLSLIHI